MSSTLQPPHSAWASASQSARLPRRISVDGILTADGFRPTDFNVWLTLATEPAEGQGADDTRQGVRGDRQPDVPAGVVDRGDLQGQPGDGDRAHPVAERRDAQASEQPSGTTVQQQPAILHGFLLGSYVGS
jgi:hypothetical protein